MQKFAELSRRQFAALGAGLVAGVAISDAQEPSLLKTVDVCVYGATASGIMAAVAASREGCAVIVVEASRWLRMAWTTGPKRLSPSMGRWP